MMLDSHLKGRLSSDSNAYSIARNAQLWFSRCTGCEVLQRPRYKLMASHPSLCTMTRAEGMDGEEIPGFQLQVAPGTIISRLAGSGSDFVEVVRDL